MPRLFIATNQRPRLFIAFLTNALNECAVFKFNKLNTHQQQAIELFVNEAGKDTAVNLATGYGKSII